MTRMVGKIQASARDYTQHVFEISYCNTNKQYIVMLDGSFLADGESMRQAVDQVEDAVKWYGWKIFVKNLQI